MVTLTGAAPPDARFASGQSMWWLSLSGIVPPRFANIATRPAIFIASETPVATFDAVSEPP